MTGSKYFYIETLLNTPITKQGYCCTKHVQNQQ